MASKKTPAAHSPSTLILLVRHGQTPTTGKILPGRAAGLHLAEAGVQQAHMVAERISELPRVDAIYASPLERARETAAPIAKALKQRVKINKGSAINKFSRFIVTALAVFIPLILIGIDRDVVVFVIDHIVER